MHAVKKDYFQGLYKVAQVVNASLEPQEVLTQIVKSVVEVMDVKAVSLRLLDKGRTRLLMGCNQGLSEGYLRKGPVLIAQSGLDVKALKGHTVYIQDAQDDPGFQYPQRAVQEGIHSLLVVPLMVEEKAIGVVRAYAAEVRTFDDNEVKFLQAVANLSAIALENARLHAALKRDYELLVQHEFRIDDN